MCILYKCYMENHGIVEKNVGKSWQATEKEFHGNKKPRRMRVNRQQSEKKYGPKDNRNTNENPLWGSGAGMSS
jgi:hypothetical protein